MRRSTAFAADLVPGERQRESWFLQTPIQTGRYELLVALEATSVSAGSLRWTSLVADLEVAPD